MSVGNSQEHPVLSIGSRLHFTSATAAQAEELTFCRTYAVHFVEVGGSASESIHISVIHRFCQAIDDAIEDQGPVPVMVCPANEGSLPQACLLFGAYLLLNRGRRVDDVVATFEGNGLLDAAAEAGTVHSWRALEHARHAGWIDASSAGADAALDMDMAAHYAAPANGGVHVVIPGRLLLLPTPRPLPADRPWADDVADGRPTARRFSAAFLADLLAEGLGASAVVSVGRVGGSDAAAFRARGLDVHGLGLDLRRPALLGAMDRLLAVSRAAPGAVGLWGWDGAGAGRVVEALAAAWLMREFGFCAGGAAAWVRMVWPGLHAGPVASAAAQPAFE